MKKTLKKILGIIFIMSAIWVMYLLSGFQYNSEPIVIIVFSLLACGLVFLGIISIFGIYINSEVKRTEPLMTKTALIKDILVITIGFFILTYMVIYTNSILFVFCMYCIFLIVIFLVYTKNINKYKYKGKDIIYCREKPSGLKPVFVRMLVTDNLLPDIYGFTATIMDLIDRNYIEILCEDGKNVDKKDLFYKDDMILSKTEKYNENELQKFEHYIVNWFINDIGDGNKVSMKVVKENLKQSQNSSDLFYDWQLMVSDEFPFESYFNYNRSDTHKIEYTYFIPPGIYLIICSLSEIVSKPFYAFLISLATIIMTPYLIIYNNRIKVKETTIIELQQWKGFKKYLEDFSNMSEKSVEDIKLWDYYLTYAICLEAAKESTSQLQDFYESYIYNSESSVLRKL